jgi:NAD(P)-dependent dehydrogenase (short-subunit alcohol dehydrogenase family)
VHLPAAGLVGLEGNLASQAFEQRHGRRRRAREERVGDACGEERNSHGALQPTRLSRTKPQAKAQLYRGRMLAGAQVGELAGLRALVTGGASGIGLATARTFVAQGAAVAVVDREPVLYGEVLALSADVSDDRAVREAVATAVNGLGGLDILVNNAAIGAVGTIEDQSDEEWHHVLDVNVVGLVRVTRAALPALRASAHAAIVNLSSIGAPLGLYRRALYDASKGAVHSLTLAMAADYLEEGIRVNCVVPGTADTPWVARLLAQAADPEAERAALIARQPHGRLVAPDEVAAAIAFLANPSSGSITGTALSVDGGMTTLRLPPSRGP